MKLGEDFILIDLDTLMRATGYGRRRALKFAEMAEARVYIGNSLRFSVKKLEEFAERESM